MTKLSSQRIQEIDAQHVWHPYAGMPNDNPVYPVASATGTRIKLTDGRELIDGMSSWWAAIHGYNNPVLNKAAKEQIDCMSHVMLGGLTHEPAARLTESLLPIVPKGLTKFFYCDSGSVSVEVAIKIAFQYWLSLGKSQKSKLLTVRSGYHGDTFGAMAVCDPDTGMHGHFSNVLQRHFFAPSPPLGYSAQEYPDDTAEVEKILEEHSGQIAAFILEPIVQGAGGMRFYPPWYLSRIRDLCTTYDVLLICDEIATGFGRSGELFGCNHANVSPDIMCIGKALTGGYMTLGATLTTDKVSSAISNGDLRVLMHGPTFMANPLALAIANASVNLLLSSPWKKRVKKIEKILRTKLEPARTNKNLADIRVLGAIGVLEMRSPVKMKEITEFFISKGVWLRPFGRLIYAMPPYISSGQDLAVIAEAMVDATKSNNHVLS